MAKAKKAASNKTSPVINFAKWRNSLPSTYETIVDGFHAEMTVDQMVKFLGSDAKIPDTIKNIKIGSFTPNIFQHPDLIDFWRSPVKVSPGSVSRALLNDDDIVDTQRKAGYAINRKKPDLETLARIAQTQYLGFYLRVGTLINNNLFGRLENLKNPEIYKQLRTSTFVESNQLQNTLPEKPPEFSLIRREFSIKQINNALSKAYTRTGKPDDLEAFLSSPEKYGVFAVNDMLRTSIDISRSQKNIDKDMLKNYLQVRNLFTLGVRSGILGIVADEMSDQVCFPSSSRPSDQYPVFMMKGKFFHAGPNNSYLELPIELQIPVLQQHAVDGTHELYKISRDLKHKILQLETEKLLKQDGFTHQPELDILNAETESLNEQRISIINQNLTTDIRDIRNNYTKNGTVPEKDKLGIMIAVKSELLKPTGMTKFEAREVAKGECPDEYTKGANVRVMPLTFGSMIQETNQALRMMIQESTVITLLSETPQSSKALTNQPN